jgi:hypothetical protein
MKRKSLITLTYQDSKDQYYFSFCVVNRGKLGRSSILTFIFSEKEEKDAGEGDRVLD